MKGLSTRHMKCTGVWPSGTAYVQLDNVIVPKSNLIGDINKGFSYIMYNFNHERWQFACQGLGTAKKIVRIFINYVNNNKLNNNIYIKKIIKEMFNILLKLQSYLDLISYQFNVLDPKIALKNLGVPCALVKVIASKSVEKLIELSRYIIRSIEED